MSSSLSLLEQQPDDILRHIASFLLFICDGVRWSRTSKRFDTSKTVRYEHCAHRKPHNVHRIDDTGTQYRFWVDGKVSGPHTQNRETYCLFRYYTSCYKFSLSASPVNRPVVSVDRGGRVESHTWFEDATPRWKVYFDAKGFVHRYQNLEHHITSDRCQSTNWLSVRKGRHHWVFDINSGLLIEFVPGDLEVDVRHVFTYYSNGSVEVMSESRSALTQCTTVKMIHENDIEEEFIPDEVALVPSMFAQCVYPEPLFPSSAFRSS